MGNVIPWSQIDPSIKTDGPFIGVVMIDPQGKLCVSDLVAFDPEVMGDPDQVASQIIAAAQQASARVATAYRAQRKPQRARAFRVLKGGAS
jgi:hypothetical protein